MKVDFHVLSEAERPTNPSSLLFRFLYVAMSTRHSFLSTTGLIRSPSSGSTLPSHHASSRGTKTGNTPFFHRAKPSEKPAQPKSFHPLQKLRTTAGVVPLGPTFLVIMAVLFSIVFIGAISLAFVGAEDDPVFQDVLNEIARDNPGVSAYVDIYMLH